MESMIFKTGGQPVALEDLELLQDNGNAMALMILSALTDGKIETFLMQRVSKTYQALEADRVKITLSGGVLVKNGEFFPYSPTELILSKLSDPVYLCLKRTEGEARRFENGETKTCRLNKTAVFSTTPDGEYVRLSDLKPIAEILRETLHIGNGQSSGIENIEVDFKNGYSGKITASVVGDKLVCTISATSRQLKWSPDEEGIVFMFRDADLAARFLGVSGEFFGTTNYNHPSLITYSSQGARLVTLVNGHAMVVGFLPPTTPINATISIPLN